MGVVAPGKKIDEERIEKQASMDSLINTEIVIINKIIFRLYM